LCKQYDSTHQLNLINLSNNFTVALPFIDQENVFFLTFNMRLASEVKMNFNLENSAESFDNFSPCPKKNGSCSSNISSCSIISSDATPMAIDSSSAPKPTVAQQQQQQQQ